MARTTIDKSLIGTVSSSSLVGTTTNDSAAAGVVGQYISSYVSATSVPTTNTWGDLTSVSLTAGDWDVTVRMEFVQNGATIKLEKAQDQITGLIKQWIKNNTGPSRL